MVSWPFTLEETNGNGTGRKRMAFTMRMCPCMDGFESVPAGGEIHLDLGRSYPHPVQDCGAR